LENIQYEKYNQNICGHLKVIAILLGLQFGCTKICCFQCEWDIRDKKHHYVKEHGPKRESPTSGEKKLVNTSLINPEKVYLLPLHIKLGLIKNFVKAMDQNRAGFMCFKNRFLKISDAKIKEQVFVGPQIRELIQDVKFEDQMSEVEKQHGNHSLISQPISVEIVRQKSIVIWWLILYNPTEL